MNKKLNIDAKLYVFFVLAAIVAFRVLGKPALLKPRKSPNVLLHSEQDNCEVKWMAEWNPQDEIDWLTGEYTYKKERLRKF